jgi:ADP-heptose:LPS heptosyltransferase
MLDSLRLRLGTWYARFHFRRAKEPVVHFTQAISQSRRAIVLLPESASDVSSTGSVLRFLEDRFHTSKVVLVVKKELVPRMPEHRGFNLFTYGPEELNTWFVPRAELLRKVKKSTFDLALDLNQGFALPSSFLCRASQAPLRIGFVKPYADDFYNFQVQTGQARDPSQAYSTLLKCIEMF